MILNHNFVLLWCLVGGFSIIEASTPMPTKNPECLGMHRAASTLQKSIQKFANEPINCLVNGLCTGLSCNGTHKNKPFYMNVVLKHCIRPSPELHLDLKYPDKKINVHQELKHGSKIKLNKLMNLKFTMERNKNKITTSLILEACISFADKKTCHDLTPLLPKTTFCVNMNTCPGFNTTTYPPCSAPMPTSKSTPSNSPTISTSTSTEPLGEKGHHHHGKGHHMSAGLAVGIGFACLAVIGIIVGVIIYWKKFHHRSRLRAAYYNDISMNDPLYEDFGPEVA